MVDKPITLGEFINESRNDIERFVMHWKKGREERPQYFPLEMPPGDWFDQFMMFLDSGSAE